MNPGSLIAGLAALNTTRNNSLSLWDKAKAEIEIALKSDEGFGILIATIVRQIKLNEPSPEHTPQKKTLLIKVPKERVQESVQEPLQEPVQEPVQEPEHYRVLLLRKVYSLDDNLRSKAISQMTISENDKAYLRYKLFHLRNPEKQKEYSRNYLNKRRTLASR